MTTISPAGTSVAGPQRLCRVDRGMGHQAARVGLDPVLIDRGPAAGTCPRPAVGGLEAGRDGVRATRAAPAAASRAASSPVAAASPTCSALPSVPNAACSPPARSSEMPTAATLPVRLEIQQAGCGDGRPGGAADRRGMPATFVQRRMARARKGRGGLEAGRIRVQSRPERQAALGGEQQRHRRHGCARVHQPGRVGVVVVEHVPGAAGRRHPPGQAVGRGASRAGRGLLRGRAPRRRASRGTRGDSDPRRSPRQHRLAVSPRSGDRCQGRVGARHAAVEGLEAGRKHARRGPAGAERPAAGPARPAGRPARPCMCRASRWLAAAGRPSSATASRTYPWTSVTSRRRSGELGEVAHVVVLLHKVSGQHTLAQRQDQILFCRSGFQGICYRGRR